MRAQITQFVASLEIIAQIASLRHPDGWGSKLHLEY